MALSDITGNIKTVSEKLNGNKKHIGVSALSIGTVVAVMHLFPNTVPGYEAGQIMATKLGRLEERTDSVLVITERVSTMSRSIEKQEERVTNIEQTVVRIAEKLGVRASESGPVVIEYKPDSARNGVIRKGDTIWVPMFVDTTGNHPR